MSPPRKSTKKETAMHTFTSRAASRCRLGLLAWVLVMSACEAPLVLDFAPQAQPSHAHEAHEDEVDAFVQELWSNGAFENDANAASPSNWTVIAASHATGVSPMEPQTFESLNLTIGGAAVDATRVRGTGYKSQSDPNLGTAASFRFPQFGDRTLLLNWLSGTSGTSRSRGSDQNANIVTQQMVVTQEDIDPADGRLHVRFAFAPVLEFPTHNYTQQPFYFIRVRNVTRGKDVYVDFNTSGQPGVPWKNGPTGWIYTDWTVADVVFRPDQVLVGETIEIRAIAAGCQPTGHAGRLYLDEVYSADFPYLYVAATAPAHAAAGGTITYRLRYRNGADLPTTNTQVRMVIPPNTTFHSVSLPSGCTTPPVGASGVVTCNVGGVQPLATGSFDVTVQVDASAVGTIELGDYGVFADGLDPRLGIKTRTVLTNLPLSNVVVTNTNGANVVSWGQSVTYTITATNAGPSAASTVRLEQQMPAQLENVVWSCAASGGATCGASAGAGDIDTVNALPVNGSVTYTVNAKVVAGTGTGTVTTTARATVQGGAEVSPDDNVAVDSDAINAASRTLTFGKTGAASGTLSVVPGPITCGPACGGGSVVVAQGSQVVVRAEPVPGASFLGWSGACTGTKAICVVSVGSNQSVTAEFGPPTLTIVSGSGQTANTSVAFGQPLVAQVIDALGAPQVGVTVTFAPPSGGASATLSSTTAVTNAQGKAQVTATANTIPGTYQVIASAPGAQPAAFLLTNNGTPASIAVVRGAGQSAAINTAFQTPLVAVVRDAAGNRLGGVTVNFTAPVSGASAVLSSASAVTDGLGEATIVATANSTSGAYNVTAAASGAGSITFNLTNRAPATITVTSGNNQSRTVGTAFANLVVTVRDASNVAIPGLPVSFSPPTTGASAGLSSYVVVTNASGQAAAVATANTVVGTYDVSASVSGVSPPALFTLTNTAGPAAQFVVGGGAGQATQAGTAFLQPLVARVTDAHGNGISGQTVSFTAPGSGASAGLSASSGVTDAQGQVSVTATANSTQGSYNVTASSSGFPNIQFPLQNLGPPNLTATGGSGQTAPLGQAFSTPLTATLRNELNQPIAGATVTFSAPTSGARAALSATSAVTNGQGQAVVLATAAGSTGSYQVTASYPGVSSITFSLSNICSQDVQCPAGEYCNGSGQSCVAKLSVGASIPNDGLHDGSCSGASTVCVSGLCNSATSTCAAGDGNACTSANQCVSNTCTSGHCVPASGGCYVDANCGAGQYCDRPSLSCVAKLPAGTAIPNDGLHGGTCSDAAKVCASGLCNSSTSTCAANDGNACTGASQCVSNTCVSGHCVPAAGGCYVDVNCNAGEYCDRPSLTCVAKLPAGTAIPNDGLHSGTCADAAEVCTSGLCNSATSTCAANNGNACTGANQCVSNTCTSGHCVPASGGCYVDGDCSSGQYCDRPSLTCVAKLPAGTAIPSDGLHGGTCADAAKVCASGLCNSATSTCAADDGAVCSSVNQCVSNTCTSGHCVPAVGGCYVDTDCGAGEYCDRPSLSCVAKLPAGTAIPNDGLHDGTCTDAAKVCVSGLCNSATSTCAANNGNACTGANQCVSNTCTSGHCVPAVGGCYVDTDCGVGEYCDRPSLTCVAKLPAGTAIPSDGLHGGTCADAAVVCASGLCNSATSTCAAGEGDACTSANQCVSNTCTSGHCVPAVGGCYVDANCDVGEYCDRPSLSCVATLPAGTPIPNDGLHGGTCADAAKVCASGLCNSATSTCAAGEGNACTSANQCVSNTCTSGHCVPAVSGCYVDTDCGAGQYCDRSTLTCATKLGVGDTIPSDGLHGGGCADAATVCATGFCNPATNACAAPPGESCVANNQCASNSCTSGYCVASVNGCHFDSDCSADSYCDRNTLSCASKLGLGVAIPNDGLHGGTCGDGEAVCSTSACNATVNQCALPDGAACSSDVQCGGNVCVAGRCGGSVEFSGGGFGCSSTSSPSALALLLLAVAVLPLRSRRARR